MVFTNVGCTQLISWISGTATTAPTTVAWGGGNTSPTKTDTTMDEEGIRATFDSTTTNNKQVTFEHVLATTEMNTVTLNEIGLFNASFAVVDDCDATTGWTASGTNSVTQNVTTYVEGTASLNLVKSDGSSTTISVSKTTTSRDFTSSIFGTLVYISTTAYADMAATDCLTIRFGSAAGDYYQYTRDKTDLAVGWNLVTFTSATSDSTTGTPVITACDYTYVALTSDDAADTWIAGNVMLDDMRVAGGNMYLRNIFANIDKTSSIEIQAEVTVRIDNLR